MLTLLTLSTAIAWEGMKASPLHAAETEIKRGTEEYIALADSADNYIRNEDWKHAEETILTALRREPGNPGNAMLLSNLGVVRTNLKDYRGAHEALDIAKTMAPKSKSVRINIVRLLLATGEEKESIDELNEILLLDSLQEWSLKTRGLLLMSQREYRKGINDIELHQQHYTPDSDLLEAGGAAYAAIGDNAKAIEWYDRAISTRQSAQAWFSRSLLKIQENRLGEADDDVRRAIAIYPDNGDLYLLRALLKKMNHLLTESEADRRTALKKGASPALASQLLD